MPELTPVDHDPFPNLVPVDHDPFADNPLAQYNMVARAIGSELVRSVVDPASNIIQGHGDYDTELAQFLIGIGGLAGAPEGRGAAIAAEQTLPAVERAAVLGLPKFEGLSKAELQQVFKIPSPANDPNAFAKLPEASYEGAVRNKLMHEYITPDADVRDFDSWKRIAVDEKHTSLGDKPNAFAAAREHSRDGKTTVLIGNDGRRTVFHDGQKVVRDRLTKTQSSAESADILQFKTKSGFEAWHGSSADFTRFSDDFIGTGEGGQSFGRGHYVAENKGVASSYRKAGIQAKTYHELMAQQYLEQAGNDPILAKLNYQHDGSPGGLRAIDKLIDNYSKEKGHLYNVRVNADPKHFLDYDRPLNEQNSKIQEAFRAAIDELAKNPWYPPAKRETIYDSSKPAGQVIDAMRMEAKARDKPTILEDSLKSHGIPGIKYLDQGSRTSKEGTRNFVVFNPDIIEILKKYGIAGLISAGVAHQSMTPVDHDPFKDGS